jgi:aminoglycoside phosphotransferase (APT) family kinase protein
MMLAMPSTLPIPVDDAPFADPVRIAAVHGFLDGPVEVLVSRADRLVVRVGEVVVKADPRPAAFATELTANSRLAAAGIPVQRVYAASATAPSYLVLSWIAGTALSATSPPAAQRDAGALLRRLHSLPAGPPFRSHPTYLGYLAEWLDEELTWWTSSGRDRAVRAPAVRDWFRRLGPVLAERQTTLTLLDGRPEHFIVSGGRLAGLIDPADAAPGDPLMDLAVMETNDPGLLAGVLAGYDPDRTERRALAEVLPFYTLLRRLTSIRWNTENNADLALARRFQAQVDAEVIRSCGAASMVGGGP